MARELQSAASVRESEASTYTYCVTFSANGFRASCHELDIACLAHTMAAAIDALRAAIEAKHHK